MCVYSPTAHLPVLDLYIRHKPLILSEDIQDIYNKEMLVLEDVTIKTQGIREDCGSMAAAAAVITRFALAAPLYHV